MLVKGYSFDIAPFVEGYFLFTRLLRFEDMYVSLPRSYSSLYVPGELLIAAHSDNAS